MINKLQQLKKNKKKGFTLIELIVVIAILAIIAALALPAFNNLKDQSAKQIALANARTVYTAGMAADALSDGTTFDAILGGEFTATNSTYSAGSATWTGTINGKSWTATYPGGIDGVVETPKDNG